MSKIKDISSIWQSILKIVDIVCELAKAMDSIFLVSFEEMQGISQVSVVVSQEDDITHNNVGLVNELCPPFRLLYERAQALRNMVEV